MSGRNRSSIYNNNINNVSGSQKRKTFLWNLDLCEFVVHSRNTATACGRLTNYYAAVGGAVGLEGLGPAHWLLFPSHVTVQLVERILGSSLSHTHPVSSPERDTAGFLFCGHSPRTFCSRPDLEADVSDSECRRRKDKGRFFPSATVAPAAAAGPQGVSLKMWNAVFWSGDGRSCAAARLLVPTETHTHTQKNTRTVCLPLFVVLFIGFSWLSQILQSHCVNHTLITYIIILYLRLNIVVYISGFHSGSREIMR